MFHIFVAEGVTSVNLRFHSFTHFNESNFEDGGFINK